ncbi:hypothetical protein PAECIP111893_00462 [Paenibacillus plantiphilus]|uniref:Butirosin biosynthesis protein H, N-terminal n=2 Tax=Paenibacillus plantiphilus TaxID=2905650 RepID=A0ABN8FVV7_9BACL|nr:hypothetical protein [Paenibacillus plantiphilus]CAH1193434.1 hypothetical protein PAECIP111893_00462 [Paenibacillus plantiphilus]
MVSYIGNGAYCYANSTAMLLESIGERISPSVIEVLTGVGFGAVWEESQQAAWFNGDHTPDAGIDNALKLLGFTAVGSPPLSEEDGAPLAALREALSQGPVVIGPLDMGMLTYNPNHSYLGGCDHYVLAHRMDDQFIYIHDPGGYPHVKLSHASLIEAWKAENIQWKRRPYRMWAQPTRINHPSLQEIREQAMKYYRNLYSRTIEWAARNGRIVNAAAIRVFADAVSKGDMTPDSIGNMKHFLFQLGARRAMDTADFLKDFAPALSELKARQAVVFGECHTHAAHEDWSMLSQALNRLAAIEEEIVEELLR